MISIAFFSNQGGVGKTSLVYHLARMYGELGYRVLAADLDPQSNLSIMALNEERLEELWPDDEHPETIFGAVQPLFGGTGDIRDAHIEPITERVALLVGDLALARLEAHQTYVQQCYGDFRTLAEAVARRTRLHWSGQP